MRGVRRFGATTERVALLLPIVLAQRCIRMPGRIRGELQMHLAALDDVHVLGVLPLAEETRAEHARVEGAESGECGAVGGG